MVKDGRYYNMIVYKRVRIFLRDFPSEIATTDTYYSEKMVSMYFHNTTFSLTYELNKDTYPRIGKIFCYSSKPHDQEILCDKQNRVALWLKCITSDEVEYASRYAFPDNADMVEQFWNKGILYSGHSLLAPVDTVLCNWIKPIEIL